MTDKISQPGEIITFYSYKGGTGRSMALANVACLLAQKQETGNDVLMIDWDLEAPGLHQFFHGRFDKSHDEHGDMPSGQLGLIDLFYEIRTRLEKQRPQDNIPEDIFAEIDIQKYIVKTNQPSLSLMPAGKFDDGLYSTRVNGFDWSDFFSNFPLVITQFAQYLRQNFRYVLIDSRTGYTDTSGICTSIMPEKLVTVFTPNRQSVSGVVELIRRAIDYRKQSDDLRPLMIFPLPSRIENAESNLRKEWRSGNSSQGFEGYQKRLENVLMEVYGLQGCDLTEYFDKNQLQYVPRYSYGEEIAVLSERSGDRLSLAYSLETFAEKLISNENPWGANADFRYSYETKPRVPESLMLSLSRIFFFSKKYVWQIALLIVIALWSMSLFYAPNISFAPTPPPVFSPVSTFSPTPTPTSLIISTPSITPTPTLTFSLSKSCKLPQDNNSYDYVVPGHVLLEDVYTKIFNIAPDSSNDLFAIAYYNNRKILEGYSIYHFVDPVSLDVRRDWRIFIPPQQWIENYNNFPVAIPYYTQTDSQSPIGISGSSILYPLTLQISECFSEMTKIRPTQTHKGNTVSGLRDYCQSKVDLFSANKEVTSEMLAENGCPGIELERFDIARYALVIIINKDNPYANDLLKFPLTNEELTRLVVTSTSWNDIRAYWNSDTIRRYYPPAEGGEFEMIKDQFFPNGLVGDNPKWVELEDENLIATAVSGDQFAMGVVSYDFYRRYNNKDNLIILPVNNSYPNSEIASAENPTYPLVATLYLYTGKTSYETDPVIRAFINFYLSYEFDFLDTLGYFYPTRKGYMSNRDTIP